MIGESVYLFIAMYLLFFPLNGARQRESTGTVKNQSTGEVRGRITLSPKTEAAHDRLSRGHMERYPAHGSGEHAAQAAASLSTPAKVSERIAVFLESDQLHLEKYPLPEQNPVLDQKNLQFHPQVLPILVGTTVDFPNRDNIFHNVFSYSDPKGFDLGRYPLNDSRSVTFDKPGTVRVYCDIHSQMSATILVLPHPYFAAPDDDGTFVIRNVPEGKYRIVFWYDRDVAERRTVDVKAGTAIELNITL